MKFASKAHRSPIKSGMTGLSFALPPIGYLRAAFTNPWGEGIPTQGREPCRHFRIHAAPGVIRGPCLKGCGRGSRYNQRAFVGLWQGFVGECRHCVCMMVPSANEKGANPVTIPKGGASNLRASNKKRKSAGKGASLPPLPVFS